MSAFEAESFDVVVTDYQMPGLNGLELMAHAREQDDHRPVIIVSGLETDLSRRAVELGAYAWLTKPLNRPLFVGIIHSAVAVVQGANRPTSSTA